MFIFLAVSHSSLLEIAAAIPLSSFMPFARKSEYVLTKAIIEMGSVQKQKRWASRDSNSKMEVSLFPC